MDQTPIPVQVTPVRVDSKTILVKPRVSSQFWELVDAETEECRRISRTAMMGHGMTVTELPPPGPDLEVVRYLWDIGEVIPKDPEASPHPRCQRLNCPEQEFPGSYQCMACSGYRRADEEDPSC